MRSYKLGEMEQQFADIIWANEPVGSRALTELCAKAFGWKRTTTYTMLKRLCDRGIFRNNGGTVAALMSKSEFNAARGEEFLNENFEGSLPNFLAAFARRNKLSSKEIDEIKRLIDQYREV